MLVRSLLLAVAIAMPGAVGASVQAEIPVSETDSGQYLSDAGVTADVKRALIAQKNLDALEIKVSTRKGVVQLSGFAGTSAQISQAIEVARGVRGVREVKNELRLKLADKP